MNKQKIALSLFWIGLIIAVAFAGIGTWSLMHNLRALTTEENNATIWAEGSPLFMLWAFSVTLGSLLAGIGAFVYVKTKAAFFVAHRYWGSRRSLCYGYGMESRL